MCVSWKNSYIRVNVHETTGNTPVSTRLSRRNSCQGLHLPLPCFNGVLTKNDTQQDAVGGGRLRHRCSQLGELDQSTLYDVRRLVTLPGELDEMRRLILAHSLHYVNA